jgi:1-hydroxy-2-isopentenylcarotenoid 3,4-desaturase
MVRAGDKATGEDSVKHVVVVGAGFGGLGAAALLKLHGYEVTVVEKNEQCGGRAGMLRDQGFSFDMGPSWYLQPDVFEHYFARFGKTPADYYKLVRLEPSYRIYFSAHDHIDISKDLDTNIALFERIEPGSGMRFKKYLAEAERKYNVSMQEFLYKEYRRVGDFFTRRMLTEGRQLHVFESFEKYAKRFFRSERMQKIVEYPVVFLGANPKKTPALYSLLAHADYNLGVWYPLGGMNAVAVGLERLGRQHKVNFRYNEPVQEIMVENGNAVGVRTTKGIIRADAVLVNADYAHAEMQLLAEPHRSYPASYWKKRTIAPSGFIIYLGLNKRIKSLAHHTLFFAEDWRPHFEQIFDKPGWPDNPSYYVCAPSKTDISVAPAGCENLFILVPVASGLSDDDEIRERFTNQILEHLEQTIGEKVKPHIKVRHLFSQRDFASRYNAYLGTALGLAHTLMQSAVFRPSMRSKKVKGLYYAGQYTHPGVGVPMALIAGEVMADAIAEDLL